MVADVWAVGDAYEAYVGRWSRRVAVGFLQWLDQAPGRQWLDVGCGTGALTGAILAQADPAKVTGVDPSEGFLATARAQTSDPRADLRVGDATSLPLADNAYDAVVSGLMLNFVPEPARAVAEFVRVSRPGGLIAAYVWDYVEGMQFMRHFWDAAMHLDPGAAAKAEGSRFSLCQPDPLRALWRDAGLDDVLVEPIEVPTVFTDFDDYWNPFLGGQGPAPAYTMSLNDSDRSALRELLRERLTPAGDGTIPMVARAWAVRGNRAA